MAFIDYTYFINEIDVPANIIGSDNFVSVINRYEPSVLKDLLGYELYKALLADLDVSGNPQTQRFVDLVNGAEYSTDDILYKWTGFANTEKVSPLSMWVYWRYRMDNDTFYSSASQQVRGMTENSNTVSNASHLVSVYNQMIDLFNLAYDFLYENTDDYPEWEFTKKEKINRLSI